ncbi:hypothetical protein FQZ97_865080 [compost metagenome]
MLPVAARRTRVSLYSPVSPIPTPAAVVTVMGAGAPSIARAANTTGAWLTASMATSRYERDMPSPACWSSSSTPAAEGRLRSSGSMATTDSAASTSAARTLNSAARTRLMTCASLLRCRPSRASGEFE